MTSVQTRKKSIVSTGSVQIEQPVANNTLLNKAAASSLYQQCSALRARLLRVDGFAPWFAVASPPDSSRQSTDPVTQLWDCLALGVPLCFLYNLLPSPSVPISLDTDPRHFDIRSEKTKKRAIALFSMQIRQIAPTAEQFTVTDLFGDRGQTDGFVKVVRTVTVLVDRIPKHCFDEEPMSPPANMGSQDSADSMVRIDAPLNLPTPANAQEAARANIIREMVETERKYVQDLEVMQRYASSLSQSIDQDTIHHLFPNLNKLLNFQRKFLIRFEGIAEMAWRDQRWGLPFIENEEDFAVYEPYCANYTNAVDLMLAEEQNLAAHNHLINAKSELPAFLIKPVQRICKYPLLLESLIKASSPADYPYHEELREGCAAAKRITDKINEAQRRTENILTVRNLESRVEDWKGHHLAHFGDLLLDDIFVVTKSDVDREYHVFLFEKIILCCKEVFNPPVSAKKVGKSNSILKKQSLPPPPSLPGGVGPPKKKSTPLLLKGRIFLTNVTQAVPSNKSGSYSLAVWWSGEDDLEYFTLRCRTEEQLKKWEAQINRLIRDIASKRASERITGLSRVSAVSSANSTNPSPLARNPPSSYDSTKTYSTSSSVGWPSAFPNGTNGRGYRGSTPYSSDEQLASYPNGIPNDVGRDGHHPPDGFGFEPDDEFEDYPLVNAPPNGRGTPMSMNRGSSRTTPIGWEGGPQSQFRTSGYSTGGAPNGLPSAPSNRPSMSRLSSAASGASYSSEASFGPGQKARNALRSQFSTTKLKAAYDEPPRSSMPAGGIPGMPGSARTRSASQPSAFVPRMMQTPPPPLPTASHTRWMGPEEAARSYKRGSGSSQSTGESSDSSPHTSSPVTPYGSSDSSLNGATLRPARSQAFKDGKNGFEALVKVKVYFHDDIFVIQVSPRLEYNDLVDKVGKKIRLCGPRRDDGPLRVKYRDEDGDMVSLGSTEDVQMAFESTSGQVTLYVT